MKTEPHIVIPEGWKLPECNHPIEKWCSNCDYDCDTYDRITHTRKYSFIQFFDIDENGDIVENGK